MVPEFGTRHLNKIQKSAREVGFGTSRFVPSGYLQPWIAPLNSMNHFEFFSSSAKYDLGYDLRTDMNRLYPDIDPWLHCLVDMGRMRIRSHG
jgi:hypothetical protein